MGTAARPLQDCHHLLYRRGRPVRILLSTLEFATLRNHHHFYDHSRGWDQTGSNGANLSFPKDFNIDPDCKCPDAQKNQWLVGLVNSA